MPGLRNSTIATGSPGLAPTWSMMLRRSAPARSSPARPGSRPHRTCAPRDGAPTSRVSRPSAPARASASRDRSEAVEIEPGVGDVLIGGEPAQPFGHEVARPRRKRAASRFEPGERWRAGTTAHALRSADSPAAAAPRRAASSPAWKPRRLASTDLPRRGSRPRTPRPISAAAPTPRSRPASRH